MTTSENEVATCDDLTQILRHKLECLKRTRTRDSVSIGNFLELPSEILRCWIPLFSNNRIDYAIAKVIVQTFPKEKNLPFSLTEKPAIAR